MELKKLYLKGKEKFKDNGFENPGIEARVILSIILSIDTSKIHSDPYENIDKIKCDEFMASIERRLMGEPSAYITGVKEFYSRKFLVNQDVLIPREETEMLVEESINILGKIPNPVVLDLGTGSGCIAASINCEFECREIYATDISFKSLLTAKKNAEQNKGKSKINFINSNLLDCFQSSSFDIIISNPPYISEQDLRKLQTEVQHHEPHISLVSADNGLFHIKKIIEGSKRLLKSDGWCVLEVGINQAGEVKKFFKENQYSNIESTNDLNGIERVIKGKWKK